ncbi:hypothetical protein ACFQU9_43635 [Actinomadura namibiensis]
MTVPNKGPAARGRQSVVLPDPAKDKLLFEAIRSAEVAEYVRRHGGVNRVGQVS